MTQTTTRRLLSRPVIRFAVIGALALGLADSALAQQTQQPPSRTQAQRRPETIEIRGQVPTPQVVTVRPRETPAYTRRILVPSFFDRSFWPSILPALEIVAPTGRAMPDSTNGSTADSASRSKPAAPRTPSGTPPAPLRRCDPPASPSPAMPCCSR